MREKFNIQISENEIINKHSHIISNFVVVLWGYKHSYKIIIFLLTGSFNILWLLLWCLCAFDSPESHPRISEQEKQIIKSHTSGKTIAKVRPTSKYSKSLFDLSSLHLSLTLSLSVSLSLSLSLSHTHTHTDTHSLCVSVSDCM